MVKQQSSSIRNDNLRLTLSGHEKQYIEDGLISTRRRVRLLSALLLVCAFVVGTAFFVFSARYEERVLGIVESKYVDGVLVVLERRTPGPTWVDDTALLSVLISSVIGFVALLKLVLAVIDLQKFRSYREDHKKFLKHYRQRT